MERFCSTLMWEYNLKTQMPESQILYQQLFANDAGSNVSRCKRNNCLTDVILPKFENSYEHDVVRKWAYPLSWLLEWILDGIFLAAYVLRIFNITPLSIWNGFVLL